MDVKMIKCMDVRMNKCMDVRMNKCMDVKMNKWMDKWMKNYLCMLLWIVLIYFFNRLSWKLGMDLSFLLKYDKTWITKYLLFMKQGFQILNIQRTGFIKFLFSKKSLHISNNHQLMGMFFRPKPNIFFLKLGLILEKYKNILRSR